MKTIRLSGSVRTLRLVVDPNNVSGFSVEAPSREAFAEPGSLSWEACFASLDAKSPTFRIGVRRAMGAVLAESQPAGSDVGSSDVNHALFARFRQHEGQWEEVLAELVEEIVPNFR